jgi:hypothetical protein
MGRVRRSHTWSRSLLSLCAISPARNVMCQILIL